VQEEPHTITPAQDNKHLIVVAAMALLLQVNIAQAAAAAFTAAALLAGTPAFAAGDIKVSIRQCGPSGV
jgi:hypothetical protein